MAKKEQELTASMIDTFREFKETKNIDRTTLVSVLEESFRNVLARIFGSDENFDVIVNPDKGDFEIYRNRVVVADGEVEDEQARQPKPPHEIVKTLRTGNGGVPKYSETAAEYSLKPPIDLDDPLKGGATCLAIKGNMLLGQLGTRLIHGSGHLLLHSVDFRRSIHAVNPIIGADPGSIDP